MKELIAKILYYIGSPFRPDPRLLSIYFHDIEPLNFEKMLRWCVKHHYRFVSLTDLVLMLEGNIPIDEKYVFISFDDGRKGNQELIPLFEKYQVPVTIFCAVEPVVKGGGFWWDYVLTSTGSRREVERFKSFSENEFNKEMLKLKSSTHLERAAITLTEMKVMDNNQYVDIQSHTMTHPILTCLSKISLHRELRESKAYLAQALNKDIFAFSYPNGSLSQREIEAAKEYYRCAVTTEEIYPVVGCDLYQIPRIVQTGDYWTNLCRIKGLWKMIDKFKNMIGRP